MQQNREEPQRNKQILFIIAVYLLLTISSHLTSNTSPFSKSVISIINNPSGPPPPPRTLLSLFTVDKYEGEWMHSGNSDPILDKGSGKASLRFVKFGAVDNVQYEMQFKLNNGLYIDDGNLVIRFVLNAEKLKTTREGTTITLLPDKNLDPEVPSEEQPVYFIHENKLQTVSEKILELNEFSLQVKTTEDPISGNTNLDIKFHLNSLQNFNQDINIYREERRIVSTVIFAILLFVISYMQFSSIMEMIRAVIDGS